MSRARILTDKVEAFTTPEQSRAIDAAFPGQLLDRASKVRLLLDFGLQTVDAMRPARPQHHQPAE